MDPANHLFLINVESKERHQLEESECEIGRGWLKCDDQRISKKHGTLKVTSNDSISITSTHTLPIFYKKRNDETVHKIEKDNGPIVLSLGDSFGFFPSTFWFEISKSNMRDDKGGESRQLKRKLPAWMNGDNSKKLKSENSAGTGAANGNAASDTVAEEAETNHETENLERERSTEANDSVNQRQTAELCDNIIDPSGADVSLNLTEAINQSDEPARTTEANASLMEQQTEQEEDGVPMPVVVKIEPRDDTVDEPPNVNDNVVDPEAGPSSGIRVKQEIKTEVKTEPGTSAEPEKPKRDCCQFGVKCYRRNPMHRIEMAHPGDSDYRLPNYGDALPGAPPCPYGSRCYRRNPSHFRQYAHPTSTDPVANRKARVAKANRDLQNVDHEEDIDSENEADPFADDDDEENDPEFDPEQDGLEDLDFDFDDDDEDSGLDTQYSDVM